MGATLLTLLREAVTHTHPLTLPLLLHAHTHAQREPACCYVARGPSSRLQAAVGAALLTLLREVVTHTPVDTAADTAAAAARTHTQREPACCYVARGPRSRLQAAVGATLLTLLREAVTHTHPLTLPLLLLRCGLECSGGCALFCGCVCVCVYMFSGV